MGATLLIQNANTRLFSKCYKVNVPTIKRTTIAVTSPSRQVPYDGWVVAAGWVRK